MSNESINSEPPEKKVLPPPPSEQDIKFSELCHSKIKAKDPVLKERLARTLAQYWPLLCEKFNLPLLENNISEIRYHTGSFLTKWVENRMAGGYNRMGRDIALFRYSNERSLVHELTHAVCTGSSAIWTPHFIAEGIAMAGESFVWIPEANAKREEIAKKSFQEKLNLALGLFSFGTIGESAMNLNLPGQMSPCALIGFRDPKIPSGEDVYSSDSGMFFRSMLEMWGPEKLKELGRQFFLSRGEEQIKKAFEKVYGQKFEDLHRRTVNFWCGEETARQAWELILRAKNYRQIFEHQRGKGLLDMMYIGHIVLQKGEATWGEGNFDVVNFYYKISKNQYRNRGPYLINPQTEEAITVELPSPDKQGIKIKRYPSLRNIFL